MCIFKFESINKVFSLFLFFALMCNPLSAQLIINEVLFDPPSSISGDANGDGIRSASEDEFIEFINNSSGALNISGFKIYDTTNYSLLPGTDTPNHTVPANTIIPTDGIYVLFGGGTPTGIPGDIVETSTTGNLSLSNAGDTITITDSSGMVILTFDSSATGLDVGADQSVSRSPDVTGNFVLHTTANANLLFSPGSTTGVASSLILSPNTTGSFIFDPQTPLNRPSFEVFYHIPDGDITTMPILMVFHGASRNGSSYRDFWIDMANDNDFIVIAPEYSTANYPNLGDNYLMSNIFDDGDNPSPETFNDEMEWTFSTLDPLFEYVKEAASNTRDTYSAWGHSGGAQFLHRFNTYLPNSNLDIAVCSNAGWYTVPETGVSFPYGIDNGQLPPGNLTTAFSKKLIVHIGQNDNDPNSPGLRHNTVVDAQQGIHRLERARYYFNTSQTTASNMGLPYNWEKHELPNVNHNAQLMANDALQFFLLNFLSVDSVEENKLIQIYPNPTDTGFVNISLSNSDAAMNVQVYDILGKQVIKTQTKSKKLNVSGLISGIYIMKVELEGNVTLTKKIIIE